MAGMNDGTVIFEEVIEVKIEGGAPVHVAGLLVRFESPLGKFYGIQTQAGGAVDAHEVDYLRLSGSYADARAIRETIQRLDALVAAVDAAHNEQAREVWEEEAAWGREEAFWQKTAAATATS